MNKMKIGKKLIIGFMVIASLVGFVGVFSAISHNNIQTSSKIIIKVLELDTLLDESVVKLLTLAQTENIKDYVREKLDYEQIRAEFDALFKQLKNEYAKKLPDLGFNTKSFRNGASELAKTSNRLIALHKRRLIKNNTSKERMNQESQLRHKIRVASFALQDDSLVRDVERMQYKSKEAIYQYKDQKHGVEWLESISKIKDNSLVVSSQDISKNLNAYERIAQNMCKIVVEQKTIETQEHLAFSELQELINWLEENQTRIVNKIKAESQALASKTHVAMFAVITGAFLVSIILGLTIAHSISKPVANLAQATHTIAQGDFSVRVDVATADEIGELAASFNKMAEDLQSTTTSIGNLNREVTERRKVEGKLNKYQSQLKFLSTELLLVEEQERTAIAIGLHEDIGHSLVMVQTELQRLKKTSQDPKTLTLLENLEARVDQIVRETRALMFELSSPILRELGFVAAVKQWLGERIEGKHKVKCKLTIDTQAIQLDSHISVILYKIVRELTMNVVKHANANIIEVRIEQADGQIQITVEDDGIGFSLPDFYSNMPRTKKHGFGIFSTKKRLESIGGNFNIRSAPGKGTCAIITSPENSDNWDLNYLGGGG